MPTSDVMKAAKTAQVRESIDRGGRSPDAAGNREMNNAALDVVEDNAAPELETSTPSDRAADAGEQQPQRQERQLSPFEQRRANIIAGFREKRASDSEEADGDQSDIRKLSRDGLPPEMVPMQEVDEDQPPQDQGEQPPVETTTEQPAKRKIKVRGQEIEVSEEELLAYAQKGAAGDDYLKEAKSKLDEVNEYLRNTKTQATSPAQTGTHPAGQNGTQPEADASAPAEGDEHHVDPYVKMAETVQLGTPEEAATEMRKTVEDTASRAAVAALERQSLRDESARSSRYLKTFQDEHPELATDHLASAVIERKLYELQAADIRALGITDDKLPKTPTDIANWHLWYRTNGYKVRNIPDLLTTAHDEFLAWKGVEKPKPKDEPAVRQAEPRVEVNVDRTQRRAVIPQQPSRTTAPRQPTQTQAAQPRDRSDVVAKMIADRAKPRGKVMGT